MKVVKVSDKTFIGKRHPSSRVFRKNDERTTYNMIYSDGKTGISYASGSMSTGITRDRIRPDQVGDKSRVYYLTANPNGEAEVVKIILSPE